ncbi:hypothetical protein EZV62_010977 [Acer yangbiense]|uniref:DUF4094 domain-containing protein n=1 Tax=Acer yangbiense TaxID=1000413 RepID=A0A5C7I384_9ROSI|nr:hypothetical protein EZV62_010977 [Acer yangbiense]
MAFFSCLAWLYVAGRLWQDTENRMLLTSLLKKNSDQRPKVLAVEDKLMVLGCKDLERRIVEAEMDLTLAKSQGGSWIPKGDALRKLEERGVVIRFVIGRSANRGDSLDRNIDEENRTTKDFLILEGHEEAQEELPKKVKFFFSIAVQIWDAEFYVKVEDNSNEGVKGGLLSLLSIPGNPMICSFVFGVGLGRQYLNVHALVKLCNRLFMMTLLLFFSLILSRGERVAVAVAAGNHITILLKEDDY